MTHVGHRHERLLSLPRCCTVIHLSVIRKQTSQYPRNMLILTIMVSVLVGVAQCQSYYGQTNNSGPSEVTGGPPPGPASPVIAASLGSITSARSSGSSSMSPASSDDPVFRGSVTSTGGRSSAPAGSGDCTSATDSVYLAQVQKIAGIDNEVAAVFAANLNAKADNSSGFFLSQILSLGQLLQQLSNVVAGNAGAAPSCLATNRQIQALVIQMQAHANDVVQGPLASGEPRYQDMLQRLGAALNAMQASAAACAYAGAPGKWLQVILTLQANINAANAVVSNNDNSSNCKAVSSAIATTILSILSSIGASSRLHA